MTKNNPGPNSCYERAAPDEPMFVLLGRDVAAPFCVLLWCKMRLLIEGPSDQVIEAAKHSEDLRDWAITLKKDEKIKLAYDAFRAACAEVAHKEIETDAKELLKLIEAKETWGLFQSRAVVLAKKLAGVE